jgi:hypothetical protein
MMPFLMVDAVRAPTASAPVSSKMVHRTMACRYVTDRDDTLVAHAFATSSVYKQRIGQTSEEKPRYTKRELGSAGQGVKDVLAPLL